MKSNILKHAISNYEDNIAYNATEINNFKSN